MTAILAFVFGIIADNFGIGISFIIISLFLTISTILINIYNKQKLITEKTQNKTNK